MSKVVKFASVNENDVKTNLHETMTLLCKAHFIMIKFQKNPKWKMWRKLLSIDYHPMLFSQQRVLPDLPAMICTLLTPAKFLPGVERWL